MSDLPEPSFSIDLRGLMAVLSVGEDGEPALLIGDDQDAVVLETGAGGSYEDAVRGAERLSERAEQLASVLRVRIGSRTPLTRPEHVDHDQVTGRQPNGRTRERGEDRRIRMVDAVKPGNAETANHG